MSDQRRAPTVQDVSDWWATAVSRVEPNVIELRGRPIQELIGTTSFVGVIWLLLRGEPPTPGEERLLEAALVASVDHGPHAPSIAIARMAVTCAAASVPRKNRARRPSSKSLFIVFLP